MRRLLICVSLLPLLLALLVKNGAEIQDITPAILQTEESTEPSAILEEQASEEKSTYRTPPHTWKPTLRIPLLFNEHTAERAGNPIKTKEANLAEDCWTSLGVFRLTAYCPCEKCCGKYARNRPVDANGRVIVYTASGERASSGVTVAVDPSVIPFGAVLQINGHTYIAQDTGGSITNNRIDIYFDDHQEAKNFGIQYAEVLIHNEKDS